MNLRRFQILLICFCSVSFAAEEEPPELLSKRQEHLRKMQRAAEPLLRDYLRTLESMKQKFMRDQQLKEAIAVDAEIVRITEQIKIASEQMVILSAVYGIPSQNRVVDITKQLQTALAAKQSGVTLEIRGAAAGIDPAPGMAKQTLITYTLNGQRKQKTFPDGYKLRFAADLK